MEHSKGSSAAKSALDHAAHASRKPGKHRVHKMEVRRGHQGGYIAKHTEHRREDGTPHDEMNAQQPEFPLNDMKALQAHMQEHMGEEGAEAGAGGGEGAEPGE